MGFSGAERECYASPVTSLRRRVSESAEERGVAARPRAREALARLGIRPRRRWGQNFLIDPVIADRIVAAAGVSGRTVLEIGPGLGALSDRLAEQARGLVLVEIDPAMAARLRERFATRSHVRVVEGDAVKIDFGSYLPTGERAVVVANLPYSVASQILLRLFEERKRFSEAVLMLQREVAVRLTATPGSRDYGILSIWTALYAEPRLLFHVPARAFHPRPKVESSVLRLGIREDPRVVLRDEQGFRRIVRASFGQRRKTLRNALSGLAMGNAFERAGIDSRRRGETLSLEEFARLANAAAT